MRNILGVRKKVGDVDKVHAVKLGGNNTTWGVTGLFLRGGNAVLEESGRGLTDIELVKEFITRNISKNYRFMEEIKRQTATVDFATHLERGLE